ncbi:AraC family transcriptional regulator [Oceanicoccus sp. KOV_DT_Chl]|uniref:helix-turn-helix domain-containing protein n=1 Tax=Oceanicoccus sp. KOV_DT_Chl TaxID=1904639 RepID=UPI000C79958E|nr:AraC family transcriptional regulator [Oceanicoccus sp. KOV_DT_Chl]
MDKSASSFLYLSKGRVLLVGNALDSGEHRHHALQITLSMEGRPLLIKHPGGLTETQCALIRPNHLHQIDNIDSWRLLILIDANTDTAKKITSRYLKNSPIATPSQRDINFCKKRLKHLAHKEKPITQVSKAMDDVLARLAGTNTKTSTMDPRIATAIKLIQQAENRDISADELAAKICLSRDRLSHLFTQEVGIPIKRYILWYRLSQTGYKIFANQSLAEAAAESGFSDAAHFSRAFRSMFGMTPSHIMRRSQSVKLIADIDY